MATNFSIDRFEFDKEVFALIEANYYARELWPIVYILSDSITKTAYIGETTDTIKRLNSHLKSEQKQRLTTVHLIDSEKFNKSATLDIESNLIKYMHADGRYDILNANLGLANHSYYQKEHIYWQFFRDIWDNLRGEGITKHSIDYLNNSDLFKYSPYKSLNQEQISVLRFMLNSLLEIETKTLIMEGGAGTGKTILAIFLFKLLITDNQDFNFKEFGEQDQEFISLVKRIKDKYEKIKIGLVIPMSSFRETIKKVFKNIKGLKANMVIGPAEVTKSKFDILIVDESHRLRKKKSIGAYIGAFKNAALRLGLNPDKTSELEWVLLQSKKTILFYDEKQSIKPSDVSKKDFDDLKKKQGSKLKKLKSQFRVLAGNNYVDYIDKLFDVKLNDNKSKFSSKKYKFLLYDSVKKLITDIKKRDKEIGLSRVVAGFSWEWVSHKDGQGHIKDIQIGDVELRWNSVTKDWINTPNAVNEVGCIHTTQGYDLNYTGIIFGKEIGFDKDLNEIVIYKNEYKDTTGRQTDSEAELKSYIVNIYKTMMLRGIYGTFIYACNQDLHEYLAKHIEVINALPTQQAIPIFSTDEVNPYLNAIPIYDIQVAAGQFSTQQINENIQWVKPEDQSLIDENYFVCQIHGESMNKIIRDQEYAIFKKYNGGSRNGKIVLVELTNFYDSEYGSSYTIKEYSSKKYVDENGWYHKSILLTPKSTLSNYETIEISNKELIEFRTIGIFHSILKAKNEP